MAFFSDVLGQPDGSFALEADLADPAMAALNTRDAAVGIRAPRARAGTSPSAFRVSRGAFPDAFTESTASSTASRRMPPESGACAVSPSPGRTRIRPGRGARRASFGDGVFGLVREGAFGVGVVGTNLTNSAACSCGRLSGHSPEARTMACIGRGDRRHRTEVFRRAAVRSRPRKVIRYVALEGPESRDLFPRQGEIRERMGGSMFPKTSVT